MLYRRPAEPSYMEIVDVHHYREQGIAVITPTIRRLDASVAPTFKHAVVARIEAGDTRLVLDLQWVKFLDSSGLGAMVTILKAVGSSGSLAVCNANGAVLGLFKQTRLDKVFAVCASFDEALARVGS